MGQLGQQKQWKGAFISELSSYYWMSDIEELKQVEHSLSNLSSFVTCIMIDGTDAKSKLVGLDGDLAKLEKDVQKVRRKLESKNQ